MKHEEDKSDKDLEEEGQAGKVSVTKAISTMSAPHFRCNKAHNPSPSLVTLFYQRPTQAFYFLSMSYHHDKNCHVCMMGLGFLSKLKSAEVKDTERN